MKPSFSASPRQIAREGVLERHRAPRPRRSRRGATRTSKSWMETCSPVDLESRTDARRARAGPCSPSSAARPTAAMSPAARNSLKRSPPSLRRERYSDRRRSSRPGQRGAACSTSAAAMPRRDRLDVAGRQARGRSARPASGRVSSPWSRDQQLAQFVVPVAHDRGQLRPRARAWSKSTGSPRLRSHHHVQLGQRRFADLDGGVDALAVQRALQHRFDACGGSRC